jgi:branched-subunit amino acid permease
MTKQVKTILTAALLTILVVVFFAPPPYSQWALGWLVLVVIGALVGAIMMGRTRR